METSRPEIAREAVGPLRRLAVGRDHRRPATRRPRLRYAQPLALLALAGLGVAAGRYLVDNRHFDQYVAALMAIGSVLPVALAPRRPLLAWRIAFVMEFAGVLHARSFEAWPWNPVQIVGFLAVLASLALIETSLVTAWAAALSLIPLFLYAAPGNAWGAAVLVVAVSLAGDVVARRRQSRRQLSEQAELTELERARRAVLEERTRIAREMHDVVAHHMSMIAVQAETAPYRVPGLGEPARAELATIATAARAALSDMRRLLGVLRAEDDDTPRGPQPGLGEMPALVETARRAGMPVTLDLPDEAVPEAVGLAAYRILQEALANAARHAPGGPVDVRGRVRDGVLELTVRNGAPTSAPAGTGSAGHGLIGMRERAALLGGTLDTGPAGDGGYAVTATLPVTGGEDTR